MYRQQPMTGDLLYTPYSMVEVQTEQKQAQLKKPRGNNNMHVRKDGDKKGRRTPKPVDAARGGSKGSDWLAETQQARLLTQRTEEGQISSRLGVHHCAHPVRLDFNGRRRSMMGES